MRLSTYIIGQGDTIEILAQQLLGDFKNADTLISINKLRYPYISDDPIDQFANQKGTALLIGTYINPSSITINNINSVNIVPNDTIVLSEGNSFGSGMVRNLNGNNVGFYDLIPGNYDQGAVIAIFPNQMNVTTQVLRTGDTLLYPYSQDKADTSNNNFSLAFGTDWKLDENGFILRANNDISTVSGLDNLGQALKKRFQRRKGALMLHPNDGNDLFSVLGEAGAPYFIGLAKYYIQECVLQDQRISSCNVDNLTIDNGTILGNITVIPKGSQSPISMPVNIPIGGVG